MSILYLNIALDVCLTLFYGIISGVVAAVVYYYIMKSIKPKIEISDHIAKEKKLDENGNHIKDEHGNLQYEYVLKIINRTKSNIEDVSYQMFIMEDWFEGPTVGNKNYEARDIAFKKRNSVKFIVGTKEKNTTYFDNCRQIALNGNLEKEWDKNNEWVEFQIVSYHSKSGSRKVHKMKYTDRKSHIVCGKFNSGETMEIIPD
ncbi:hypothetical protein [Winogradskyella algicola]|uniref:hypothetical protein n=1 Tax=Winogradskyella algicola TaxID=2575815 RepID=UPI0011092ABF|nr:hypothetical protein [Winogradskyella algicola]